MPENGRYVDRNVNVEKTNSVVNLMEQGLLDDVMFDRFHMTEYVYSYHTRNVPASMSAFEDIDKRIAALENVWLILVEPIDIEKSRLTAIKNKLKVARIEYDSYDVLEYG